MPLPNMYQWSMSKGLLPAVMLWQQRHQTTEIILQNTTEHKYTEGHTGGPKSRDTMINTGDTVASNIIFFPVSQNLEFKLLK